MDAYIYNAALLCEECASELRVELGEENRPDTGDSDDYPQGPYADGGGEADCPQHCDSCGLFLENPLTSDGDDYVREAIEENGASNAVVNGWREFYDYL
jgi:hypothetical protein